jgi:hypothetical protein
LKLRGWRLWRRHDRVLGTRIKVIKDGHLTHIMCAHILC